jgi:cell wall-associated NlpC family hydrolase
MSINPLNTIQQAPAPVIPERQQVNRNGTSDFGTLLDRLQNGSNGSRSKQIQDAAQLIQMEMMQTSLSLAGDGEAPRPAGSPMLATLLARLAENGRTPNVTGAVPAPAESAATTAPPPAEDKGSIVRTASRFLDTPYLFGGEGSAGIDCSSMVQQVFREHRIDLPRTALEQSKVGKEVAVGELQEGDLVFFHTYASYPSHVGIYLGDGKMIHASSGSGKVTVSDINSGYYKSRFIGAKRVA